MPGVGPRQARRMVFHLLRTRRDTAEEIARLILDLKKNVSVCTSCFRHFVPSQSGGHVCSICSDTDRSNESLMVVEKDVDFENIERSGVFTGKYFILGGMYAPLAKEPEAHMRIDPLLTTISDRAKNKGLKEIVIALAVNPDGEETARLLARKIKALDETDSLRISMLGRGLSTGSELEYADSDTIKSAFETRT